MTNRDKLISALTSHELHLAFCNRNYDPYLRCSNCPIFTPNRPCTDREAGKVSNAFDEWLNKEVEE